MAPVKKNTVIEVTVKQTKAALFRKARKSIRGSFDEKACQKMTVHKILPSGLYLKTLMF
jgi:hypothetical protein